MNRWPALGLTLAVAACSGQGIRVPLPLNVLIGAQGGEFIVGNGEISLVVPAGALSGDVRISLASGRSSPMPGWIEPGGALEFSPATTAFALPAQLVIPYNPARVSSAVMNEEVRVGYRNGAGVVSALTPTFVDPDGHAVSFESLGLGTFWVVAPDVVAAADLFPLGDGDTYRYDSGLTLTVALTAAEPNFATTVAKVSFTQNGRTWGFYFANVQLTGQLTRLGEFDADHQEVLAPPALLIAARDAVGTPRTVLSGYTGYRPFGSTQASYQGTVETSTLIAEREIIAVPRGDFETVRVPVTTRFNDNRPESGAEQIEFWFAKGVGPVAIRLDGASVPVGLVEATVGGVPADGR